ncbi:MAG: hydroxymethylglutaryl-CoA reductase [Hyphomicrobium sp.]
MSLLPTIVRNRLEVLRALLDPSLAAERLRPRLDELPKSLRLERRASAPQLERLWSRLSATAPKAKAVKKILADPTAIADAETFSKNIENYAGTIKVPFGIAGPLRINGLHAHGDYFIPLATTEAALVASYARGAQVATKAGGVSAALLSEGVLRSPAFIFADLLEAGAFVNWIAHNEEALKAAAESTTRYGKLFSLEPYIDGEIVFLLCRYSTGDASGQNMVTIATEALCRHIASACPIAARRWYIEGNFSGDKKATFLGLLTGRGRKVTASIILPKAHIEKYLRTTPGEMLDYARVANLGARLNGQIGAQGHYANGLAAFYIATGQDAACVAESAVGSTRMEDRSGDLFMSVTMPNILVGTVGGGTGLPSQNAALSLLGLQGPGHAAALAEVTAALCLCGEISIMAAIASGQFTHAHGKLARGVS